MYKKQSKTNLYFRAVFAGFLLVHTIRSSCHFNKCFPPSLFLKRKLTTLLQKYTEKKNNFGFKCLLHHLPSPASLNPPLPANNTVVPLPSSSASSSSLPTSITNQSFVAVVSCHHSSSSSRTRTPKSDTPQPKHSSRCLLTLKTPTASAVNAVLSKLSSRRIAVRKRVILFFMNFVERLLKI